VLLYALFAAIVFGLFRVYGARVMAGRSPDTPSNAAREFVLADNTVVGLLGGIREVTPIEAVAMNASGAPGVALSARVVGTRDSGRFYADIEQVDGRWVVARASLVLPGGERLPLAGGASPALEPRESF
jgi:hypothetical protein